MYLGIFTFESKTGLSNVCEIVFEWNMNDLIYRVKF